MFFFLNTLAAFHILSRKKFTSMQTCENLPPSKAHEKNLKHWLNLFGAITFFKHKAESFALVGETIYIYIEY